jgi:hypothetical protein
MTPTLDDHRLDQTMGHLFRLWGPPDQCQGQDYYVHLCFGLGQYLDEGKVRYSQWEQQAYRWPTDHLEVLWAVHERSRTEHVFFTPCPHLSPARKGFEPAPYLRWCWWDIDHCTEEQRAKAHLLAQPGGMIISSGRGPNHLHLYARLSEPTPAPVVAELNRRGVKLLGADASPSALNGLLRPAGSINHKPVLEGRPAGLVGLMIDHKVGAEGWTVSDLDRLFPDIQRRPPSPASSPLVADRFAQGVTPVNGWTPGMRTLIRRTPAPMQRSAHHYAITAAAFENGYTLENAIAACEENTSIASKYGPRLAEETRRIWEKLAYE